MPVRPLLVGRVKVSRRRALVRSKAKRLLVVNHYIIDCRQQIGDDVESVMGLQIPMALSMPINLALEEAVTNVMMYAYPGRNDGKVLVEYTEVEDEAGKRLIFTVSDTGIPFDPTKKEEVDTTLSAEERAIGGLGIHLVRQLMDEVRYARVEDKNILTLVKKI